jgi:hypothetical protein
LSHALRIESLLIFGLPLPSTPHISFVITCAGVITYGTAIFLGIWRTAFSTTTQLWPFQHSPVGNLLDRILSDPVPADSNTNWKLSDQKEEHVQVRTGAAIFLSGIAHHLPNDDPKIASIVATLKDILKTPSSIVQETASMALTPIARKLAADETQVAELVKYFLETATKDERYSQRRGAAFGLAGLVKGLGIAALKKLGIMDAIKGAVDVKSGVVAKEGGLMLMECMCLKLGRMFEPYLISVLPLLLSAFGDPATEVRVWDSLAVDSLRKWDFLGHVLQGSEAAWQPWRSILTERSECTCRILF